MKRVFFATTALVLASAPFAAHAQDWTVKGSVGASLGTTSNVLAAAANEQSDTVYGAAGKVTLATKSDAGSLSLFGSFDLTHYADNDDENADDYAFGANGSLKIAGGDLFAGASHALTTEDRHKVTARRDTKSPTESTVDSVNFGINTRVGGMGLTARADYVTNDFEDARRRVTNAVVDQDFRDRGTWTETLRLTGSPDADVSWFGEVVATQIDYDLVPPAVLHNRDSKTVIVGGGVTFNMTDELTGEIKADWGSRSFDNPAWDDETGVLFSGELTWTPSKDTTVVLSAARTWEETTVSFSPFYEATAVGVRVTHSYTPDFKVGAYVSEEWDDHRNRDREDTTGAAGVSAAWKVAPNAEFTAAYDFSTQDSSGIHQIPGYDDGRFTVGFKVGF